MSVCLHWVTTLKLCAHRIFYVARCSYTQSQQHDAKSRWALRQTCSVTGSARIDAQRRRLSRRVFVRVQNIHLQRFDHMMIFTQSRDVNIFFAFGVHTALEGMQPSVKCISCLPHTHTHTHLSHPPYIVSLS